MSATGEAAQRYADPSADPAPTPRNYAGARARNYADLTGNPNPSIEEVNPVRGRRWTRDEMNARYRRPDYRHGWPDEATLDRLVAEYTRITGDPVRTPKPPRKPKKRHLIAGCYGVHGEEGFIRGVTFLFAKNGDADNLLGELLLTPDLVLVAMMLDQPDADADPEPAPPRQDAPALTQAPQCLEDDVAPLTLFAEFDEVVGSPGARALAR